MTFDETLQQAIQHTVIDFIRKGEWMKLDHNAKINIDSAWLRKMHSMVDMDTVMKLVATQVEQRICDGIINSMTTEIATDIKSIMSNKELREDLRSVIRTKIREVKAATCDQYHTHGLKAEEKDWAKELKQMEKQMEKKSEQKD